MTSWKLYQLLGVDVSANDDELKKAYRAKAQLLHPDKGGDNEKYKEMRDAFEILSDPVKRQVYDRYGDPFGEHNQGNTNHDNGRHHHMSEAAFAFQKAFPPFATMFQAFFEIKEGLHAKASSHRASAAAAQKSSSSPPPTLFTLDVTLKDLFTCATRQLKIKQSIECDKCRGSGGVQMACTSCAGAGCRACDNRGAFPATRPMTTRPCDAPLHETSSPLHEPRPH